MGDILLKANDLKMRFGSREVVKGVSLNVHKGEIVGLLGKNGAGKTTTFRMLMGLLRSKSGGVSFCNTDVGPLPMYKRARLGMGYLAQEPSIFGTLSVADNILAVLELLDIPKSERSVRLDELIEMLRLQKVVNSKAHMLSGGERRRLEIARTLAVRPSLLLFDEPFSGVDPIAVYEIQEIIYDLREKGFGILLTDHNVRETLAITDRAYIMEDGTIWVEGTPEELVKHPEAKRLYLGERFELDVSAIRLDKKSGDKTPEDANTPDEEKKTNSDDSKSTPTNSDSTETKSE